VRVRRAALWSVIASSALGLVLARPALAACRAPTAPCVDAEPMWQSPSAVRFTVVSDAAAVGFNELALGTSFTFRWRPAVLTVPAPNENGRDVNLVKDATALTLAARWGIGNRLELTALAAGLSQHGAGIKGVTSQSAPPVDAFSLQDPRIGFGYALNTGLRVIGAKIRFEAKLPLGDAEALAGEPSFVASPSFAASAKWRGLFGGLELGARLRRPSDFFGLRVGSQALIAAGLGYELAPLRLSLTSEFYVLPSLIDTGRYRYLPAEWLVTTRYAPRFLGNLSLGIGGGGGLPLIAGPNEEVTLGFGLPSFRGLVFARLTPAGD
jgi:hypothetical protein